MFRSDIWIAAFVRRHNDLGHICVVSRKGDPVAGQIFVVLDHLDGTVSLYSPAPMAARTDDGADRIFQTRFDHVEASIVRDRIAREADFDPDFWVITLELRRGDLGLVLV